MDTDLLKKIRDFALRLLSGRDHSIYELRLKLQKKFSSYPEEMEGVIQECIEKKYLDDERFAQEWIRFREEGSPRGTFLLKQELRKKGVSPEVIDSVLSHIPETDGLAKAETLAKKKISSFPPDLSALKKRERLFRFLLSRGFDHGVIAKILSSRDLFEK